MIMATIKKEKPHREQKLSFGENRDGRQSRAEKPELKLESAAP